MTEPKAVLGITKRNAGAALAVGAGVFLVVMTLQLAGVLESAELAVYDSLVRAGSRAPVAASPIVLIRIDEEDIRKFGYPICDELLARSLTALLSADPRVIGVDLYRDMPIPGCPNGVGVDRHEIGSHVDLAEVVTGSDRVVMTMKVPEEPEGGTPLPFFLEGRDQVGFSDLPVDVDGIVRRGLLFLWHENQPQLSFGLQLAVRYLFEDGVTLEPSAGDPGSVRLGSASLRPFDGDEGGYVRANDGGYQFLLDYKLGPVEFPSYTFRDLISHAIPREAVNDKVVIVGISAPSVKDRFLTPLSRGWRTNHAIHGIELHAHIVSQLIRLAFGRDRSIHGLGQLGEMIGLFVLCLCGASFAIGCRSPWISWGVGIGGIALLVFAAFGLFARGTWVPAVAPTLAWSATLGLTTICRTAMEQDEQRRAIRLFSRYLRPKVAEEIWRQRSSIAGNNVSGSFASQRVTLTVLIADLQGSTAVSGTMEPEAYMTWINQYLSAMAELVERHGGIVDDYAGDGIKANFGFPGSRANDAKVCKDAVNAVRCAVAMGEEMKRLNDQWRADGVAPKRIRIGIATGPAVVGTLGGAQSLKYTSVGETVHVAASLESHDKQGFASDSEESASRVLIGESTHRCLSGAFRTADLGLHTLKGRPEAARIYRVVGPAERAETERREGK